MGSIGAEPLTESHFYDIEMELLLISKICVGYSLKDPIFAILLESV